MANAAPPVHIPTPRPSGFRISHLLAPLAFAAVVAAVVLVVTNATRHSHPAASASTTRARHLPASWTVRSGDTLMEIAAKTGLTVAQLEALNPNVDPASIFPGERLKLSNRQPQSKPRPKPLGPQYWTVQSGQSFGSIAARTGISITALETLNPRLKPSALQPGDRVKLRR